MFSLIAHCDEDCQFHNSCLGSSKLRRFTNIWRFNVRLNHVLKCMTTYLLSRKFQRQKFLMDLSRYLFHKSLSLLSLFLFTFGMLWRARAQNSKQIFSVCPKLKQIQDFLHFVCENFCESFFHGLKSWTWKC